MLIPVTHENMRGRRWPWITTILIGLNILCFLGTHWKLDNELRQLSQIRLKVILLTARFPNVPVAPDVASIATEFKRQHKAAFAELGKQRYRPINSFDAQLQDERFDEADATETAAELGAQLQEFRKTSIAWTYAYHSYEPTAVSFITWNFLHGGWLHIIFNMWFLWLAGTILEDTWGRVVYTIFYLLSGVMAALVHGAVFPNSLVECLGASGAIAGLMGAFLARFPTTKIKLMLIWMFGVLRRSWMVPAYILLPAWLVIQMFWGAFAAAGIGGGIAYWAHIGGFAFGMLGAVILRTTGLEQAADEAIEAKVSWTADPRIVRATELMEANQFDGAVSEMQALVKEQPDSIEAHELLLKAQDRQQDIEGQKQTVQALVRLHVAANHGDLAWGYYEQFQNLGGDTLPRGVWMALCRYLETTHAWETAVEEYTQFAKVNEKERQSVMALVSAARICLTQLHRREQAEALYRAAQASPVAHLDLEGVILDGLKQCAAAESKTGAYITQ